MHYPFLQDIETYLGNKVNGAYSILNELYIETLGKYLPEDVSNSLESENSELTNPNYPYYYNLNNSETEKLVVAGNTEVKSFEILKELGYEISKNGDNWTAKNYNFELMADSPLSLLGLVTILRKSGSSIEVSDESINEFIEMDKL